MEENYTYIDGEWTYTGFRDKKKQISYEELKKKKDLTLTEKQILKYCKKMLDEK